MNYHTCYLIVGNKMKERNVRSGSDEVGEISWWEELERFGCELLSYS